MCRLPEIILAGTVSLVGTKIIAGKFNNIKNKMADEIKLEVMKIMESVTVNFYFTQENRCKFVTAEQHKEVLFAQSF